MELKEQEIKQRRENELQKAALSLRERQFEQSLTDIKTCFEKGKQIFANDLMKMEKLAKKMRRSRRRAKTRQIAELSQKEAEFDDLLSCTEGLSEAEKLRSEGDDSFPFEVGLGGVIFRKNGEPLELTTSAKWDSNYDDTNSLVVLCIRSRKLPGSWSTHATTRHV